MEHNPERNFNRARIETFSDGVFAIIVTLLVLEIKIPHLTIVNNKIMCENLVEVLPKILTWAMSFLMVCVIWMNHHRLLEMFTGIDTGLFWLNNFVLLASSIIPFPTALLGDYIHNEVAVAFFGLCSLPMSVAFLFLRIYVIRHPHLLKNEVSMEAFTRGTYQTFLYGTLSFLIGIGLSFLSTWLAVFVYCFIPIYFILPNATKTK